MPRLSNSLKAQARIPLRWLPLLVMAIITGCSDDTPVPITEPPARPAIIVTVRSDTAGNKLRLPGVVRAALRAELSFEVAGSWSSSRPTQAPESPRHLDDTLFVSRVPAAEAECKRTQADYQRTAAPAGAGRRPTGSAAALRHPAAHSRPEFAAIGVRKYVSGGPYRESPKLPRYADDQHGH